MEISQTSAGQLSAWHCARPVLALMGEYSAGKSTLLNLLLDGDVLPTKVTATNLPAVWVTFSETPFVEGLRHDGTLEPVDMEALGETVRDDYLLLRLGHNAEVLKRTDIVDTPGISDPKLAKGATLYLADYLDAVLWLSPANQAWRQTEKTVWTAFPERLYEQSLLVMTRADKMRRASDLTKVLKRVKQETKTLFGTVLPLNTPLAASSKDTPDSEDWDTSGGKSFFEAFEVALERASAEQSNRKVPDDILEAELCPDLEDADEPAELPSANAVEIEVSEPEPTSGENEPVDAESAKPAPKVAASTMSDATPDWLRDELSNCVKTVQNFDQIVSKFEHLRDRLDTYPDINPTKRFVLKQCLNAGDNAEANVERLLEQAQFEMADFEKDSWCVIVPGRS